MFGLILLVPCLLILLHMCMFACEVCFIGEDYATAGEEIFTVL
jgi:hypothetical protein